MRRTYAERRDDSITLLNVSLETYILARVPPWQFSVLSFVLAQPNADSTSSKCGVLSGGTVTAQFGLVSGLGLYLVYEERGS